MKAIDSLSAQQKRVAQLLVDNEFGLLTEDGKKISTEAVAEMASVARSTIFEWKKKPEFIVYMNGLADRALEVNRAEVYAGIMKLVRGGANGVPSVKALDLYLRRYGLLTDRQIVESGEEATKREISEQERTQALDKLDRLLDGSKSE